MSDNTSILRSGIVDTGTLERFDESPKARTRQDGRTPVSRPFNGTLSAYAKAALERECSELASCPRGTPGGRHRMTFKVAAQLGELVAGGALPRELVISRVLDAAAACGAIADYGERKVMEQIEAGLAAGEANPRHGDVMPTASTESQAVGVPEEPEGFYDDDQEAARVMLASTREYTSKTSESWPKSTFESINDPGAGKVDYLIEGLIPKGEVTIIGATWKTGKTLAFYHLALAALSAKRVFGRFAIREQIKVCVFQLEMPEREDLRRYRRLAIGLGMLPEEVTAFARDGQLTQYNRPDLTLCDPGGVKAFQDAVLASGAHLVIVDSIIAAFAGADINNNSVVRKLFTSAFAPLTSRGITVVLLHHKRKAPSGFKAGQDDDRSSVLGAQAWGAAAGRVFTLDRLPKKGEQADGEPADSTNFCVRLAVSGSWTPEEAGDVVLEITDRGEATAVTALDDVAQATSKKLTKTERGALALARLVRERVSIAQQSALILVRGKTDISVRTLKDSVAYAKEQGWIDSHGTPGAKHGDHTLVPGADIDGAL